MFTEDELALRRWEDDGGSCRPAGTRARGRERLRRRQVELVNAMRADVSTYLAALEAAERKLRHLERLAEGEPRLPPARHFEETLCMLLLAAVMIVSATAIVLFTL